MSDQYSPNSISSKQIHDVLSRYFDYLPENLVDLEQYRLRAIPDNISERAKTKEGAHITRSELKILVEWKLKHGTFRPNLLKLVMSNSEQDVVDSSKKAFSSINLNKASDIKGPITILAKLKGIGPATASLVLSCYNPEAIPFFSDELYLYVHWNYDDSSNSGIWSRRIKYTLFEYSSLFKEIWKIRQRIEQEDHENVSYADLEKVAFVLRKETAAGLSSSDDKVVEGNMSAGKAELNCGRKKRVQSTGVRDENGPLNANSKDKRMKLR